LQSETMSDTELCLLCKTAAPAFFKDVYYLCPECGGIFRPERLLLSPEREKARYETHNNDVNDVRYQNFVSPIVNAVLKDFAPGHLGLDFGAGTGPVAAMLLHEQGYQISPYDPFFCNQRELLTRKYDYIVCCEVIEHFYHPAKEFELLKSLLNKGGKLYCMTELYRPQTDFVKWRYRNDETHVFIYQPRTLAWIQQKTGFADLTIAERLIEFTGI